MKKLFILFSIGLLVYWLNGLITPVRATVCGDALPTEANELSSYISDCNNKLSSLSGQKQTLASAIGYLNTQIKITQAKISATTLQLDKLNVEIGDLTGKIESIDYSLDDLTKLFISRVRETYMRPSKYDTAIIAQSSGLGDILRGVEYTKKVRDHDRSILLALEKSRLDFNAQKQIKELKQHEVEALKRNLDNQQASLASQKTSKDKLLTDTKNEEVKYQELLSQALAEKSAIEKALVSGVKVGPIKRGEPIALVGNSGYPDCSTGKHLHFEVRQGGSWTNPGAYLESKSVYDEESGSDISLGSGSWSWPIEAPIRLTQHYGSTPYSWRYTYSGGIHTGFDLVPKNSDVIRAPADGTLYKSAQGCGSSIINIVYIDHGNDVISLYLHVQ